MTLNLCFFSFVCVIYLFVYFFVALRTVDTDIIARDSLVQLMTFFQKQTEINLSEHY